MSAVRKPGMRRERAKPVPGHKPRINYGVEITCGCGWHSTMWFSKGARENAYSQWRWHVEKFRCQPGTEKER